MTFTNSITAKLNLFFIVFAMSFTLAVPTIAAPILKSNIKISSAIVTVGDMFDNAGLNAERALFRAPAPGTTGSVNLNSIRLATSKAGMKTFDANGVSSVRVERSGVLITQEILSKLITDELSKRGIISADVIARPNFNKEFLSIYAVVSDIPLQLNELLYSPNSDRFTAHFQVAGQQTLLVLRGRLNLMIELPHLNSSLKAGTIISKSDIEMRQISLNFAQTSGFATKEQIVGMQLIRPTRKGMMLRPSDITEPELVKRSAMVTIYYKKGPLTLTAQGQALNSAAKGEMVSVLNTTSKQIVRGIATQSGAVEIITDVANIAKIKG